MLIFICVQRPVLPAEAKVNAEQKHQRMLLKIKGWSSLTCLQKSYSKTDIHSFVNLSPAYYLFLLRSFVPPIQTFS